MLLLYRDKSKLELWEEREVEGVGTLNYYISPGIDEEMMDYILEEVDGVVDYDLIPGYYEVSTIYVENPAAVFMGTFADWYSCVSFCYDYKLCSNPDNWWANIWNGTPGERTESLYRERNRGSYCPWRTK